MKRKVWSLVLVLTLAINLLPLRAQAKNVSGTYYTVNGITVPLADWPAGGKSYGKNQCWAFCQMVYQKIWGVGFNSYRNTTDDMLRKIGTGADRAITAANAKRFITAAKPGAVIRMTDDISGTDNRGTKMHSIILVQKDERGFTYYDSSNNYGVRLLYFTWAEFADRAKCYKYFKYIKFPGAPALQSLAKPDSVTLTANKTSCPAGEVVTFTAGANNASHFVLNVKKNGAPVYTSPNFSTSTTWSPSSAGTYTATVSAVNGNGSTTGSQTVTVSAYDSAPSAPTTVLSTETPIYGQNVTISWYGSTNVRSYSYQILKDGVLYRSGSASGSDSYTATFPEGSYTVKVTATNPFGSTSTTKRFVVSGCTASGTCGDHITWRLNTKEGLLILSGYGEMSGGGWTPWNDYRDSIIKADIDDRITSIGSYAFFKHSQLKYVHFPDQLTEIGYGAFAECSNLVGDMYQYKGEYLCYDDMICLPRSLSKVGNLAFYSCTSLKSVYFNAKPNQTAITFDGSNPTPFSGCCSDLSVSNTGSLTYEIVNGKLIPANPMGYPWSMNMNWFWVYFDTNGGKPLQGDDQIGNSYGSNYELTTEIPQREGYTFLGWYTTPEGGTQVTTNTPVNRLHSHTLFAHWRANEYTVSLEADDASYGGARLFSAQETITVGYWETYGEMPTPAMDGYIFTGWSTSPDGGEIITEDSIYTLSEDQTLYATWEPIPSDYDTPGSSGWEGIRYNADRDIAVLTSFLPYDHCMVMRACYDSKGKMLSLCVRSTPIIVGENTVSFDRTPPTGTSTIKIMAVDSDTLAPIFEADVE